MVQFLSIFFSWISSIFVGFFKSSRFFCVTLYVRWRYFSCADQRSLPWSNYNSLRRTPGLSYEYGFICPLLTATTPNVGTTTPWDPNRTIRPPRLSRSLRRRRDGIRNYGCRLFNHRGIYTPVRKGLRRPLEPAQIQDGLPLTHFLGFLTTPTWESWVSPFGTPLLNPSTTHGHDSQHKWDYEQGKPTLETYAWPTAYATSTHTCLPKYGT